MKVDCEIRATSARYLVNGELIASCQYAEGSIANCGHIGFKGQSIVVDNVSVTVMRPRVTITGVSGYVGS